MRVSANAASTSAPATSDISKFQTLSPVLTAALLLAGRDSLSELGLLSAGADDILAATKAGRSQAYAYKKAILDSLPSLQRSPGRPPAEPEPDSARVQAEELRLDVMRYVMAHPGCVSGGPKRRRYSSAFRCFVLELRREHRTISVAALAKAIDVALATVEAWLADDGVEDEPAAVTSPQTKLGDTAETARVQSVLAEWGRWAGGFSDFCEHVQDNLRIDWGRSVIADLLELHGVRIPLRRPGRSPDEKAVRAQFQTYFPDAQWVGDGMQVILRINEEAFTFNLEMLADTFSAALVGASIRDEEDSAAVIEAFNDGLDATLGTPPLATLLDNKPANLTDEVKDGLGETMRILATLGRPQNKGHIEGAFGLFQQAIPTLSINASTPRELARGTLKLIVQTWARLLNNRPRSDRRDGKSRVEIHNETRPTAEEIERARSALAERQRVQEAAKQTREARQDPLVRALLDEAFVRLALLDPDGNIRSSIAGYPRGNVIAGIATFESKRAAGTLPPGVDGRYLLGIVRNITEHDEGMRITDALIRLRIDARDRLLAGLATQLAAITMSSRSLTQQLDAVADNVTSSDWLIDRLFWVDAASRLISTAAASQQMDLLQDVARRIHAVYRVPYRDRLATVRSIAAKLLPLE